MIDYKNEILNMIRLNPMTYAQIKAHFNLEKDEISNYLTSLKKFKFIKLIGSRQEKNQTYIALNFTDDYHDFVKKYTKENAKEKKIQFNENAIMKVSCNDYHTKGWQEKRSTWIGSTFGTMEY